MAFLLVRTSKCRKQRHLIQDNTQSMWVNYLLIWDPIFLKNVICMFNLLWNISCKTHCGIRLINRWGKCIPKYWQNPVYIHAIKSRIGVKSYGQRLHPRICTKETVGQNSYVLTLKLQVEWGGERRG